MTVKLIGGAPFAVSIILTVFMAGLGLGSYLSGRYLHRINNPKHLVRLYGLLELGIAGFALLIPLLLHFSTPLYSLLYNHFFDNFWLYSLATFAGCAIIFTLPVVFMGATLPVLSRFYVSHLSHMGTHTGRLYGINTLGAAAGALVCGFWLIDFLGVWETLALAIAINALIGLACLYAAKSTASSKQTAKLNSKPETATTANDIWMSRGVLIIFAVSGFTAMACEVIWTKLLALIVGPTIYSFTVVLVTFILGLAVGSIIFGWLADKTGKPFKLLIITQIIAALSVLFISQLLGDSQLFFAKLILEFKDNFTQLNVAKSCVLFIFMLLPTLCFGAAFPLVGKIYTRSVSGVGKSIGNAYAINTIGSVLGSFSAGFLLIPLLGKEQSLSLVVALQLVTVFIIGSSLIWREHKPLFSISILATPVLIGLFLTFHLPSWDHSLLSVGKYQRFDTVQSRIENATWLTSLFDGTNILQDEHNGELVFYGDGIGGFTTVMKYPDVMGEYSYTLLNSGKPDASSRGDMNTQTLSAHIPMLFHENASSVMILGLASGVTAGEVLHYPVKHLDIVDINQQVVKASQFFTKWNNHVLIDPRASIIVQDARAHLNLTHRTYDVIISEPSNPWMAGLATLFTEDFFTIAKNRLNKNGIFVQFMHSYQMDWPTFSLVGRTFAKTFQNNLMLVTSPDKNGSDFLFIGFNGKDKLKLENAVKNLVYAKKSTNVVLSEPKNIFQLIISEDLNKTFADGPINSDNYPLLEYAAPRTMYQQDPAIAENLKKMRWLSKATQKISNEAANNIDSQIDNAAFALSLYNPFMHMVNIKKTNPMQKNHWYTLVESYCSSNPADSLLFEEELARRCRQAQLNTLLDKLDTVPDKAATLAYIASLHAIEGNTNLAIKYYSRSLLSQPEHAERHNMLGTLVAGQGRPDEAALHFMEALRIDPTDATIHNNLGYALMGLEKIDQAIPYFKRALQINPGYTLAQINLADALARSGKLVAASVAYQKAYNMSPDDTGIRNKWSEVLNSLGENNKTQQLNSKVVNKTAILAKRFFRQGKLEQSVNAYIKALDIEPENADIHNELGYVLARQNKIDEAVKHLEKAVGINPNMLDTHNNLGTIYLQNNQAEKAIKHFNAALQINPNLAHLHSSIARALLRQNKAGKATIHFEKALILEPGLLGAMNNLAWILATHPDATVRDGKRSVLLAQRASKLSNNNKAEILDTLAIAYASAGRFPEAIEIIERTITLSNKKNNTRLTNISKKYLTLFKQQKPFINHDYQ